MRQWTEEIRAGWGSRLDVVVHDSAEGMADARLRQAVLEEGGNVAAFFDPKDGRIHLLADRVASKVDAERLLRHEGIHWAINGKLSKEYAAILDGVRKLISDTEWKKIGKDYPNASDRVRVEEYLANLGQKNPKAKAWEKFAYEVKKVLKEYFSRDFEVTDADVRAFLDKANRKVERDSFLTRDAGFSGPGKVLFNRAREEFDETQQKAYEKVISENHATLPEYLADQSRAFGEAAEAADGRRGAGASSTSSERSFGRKLAGWAEGRKKLISAEEIEGLSLVSDYTSEHTVYYRAKDDRVVKITKNLYYGEIPVVEDGVLTSRGALPAEYLRRIELQAAVFHSDVRLEGVHIPKESILNDPMEAPQIVISQPYYEQVGRVTLKQVDEFLQEAGFEKVPDSFYGWVRRSDGVVIQDATTDNFVLTEDGLYPLDLQMSVLSPEALKELDSKPPKK